MSDNNWLLYKHTTPDGRIYFGITCNDLEVRFANGNGYKNTLFFSAIVEFGWRNITHEIVKSGMNKKQAMREEFDYIQKFKTYDIKYGFNNSNYSRRTVKCITTGEIFPTIKEAGIKYKIDSGNISKCCRGLLKSAGKFHNGDKLEWEFYNPYEKLQ